MEVIVELSSVSMYVCSLVLLLMNPLCVKIIGVKKVRGQSEAVLQIGMYTTKNFDNKNIKRWPSDKANHSCKICYKLLYVIQVVKKIFDE